MSLAGQSFSFQSVAGGHVASVSSGAEEKVHCDGGLAGSRARVQLLQDVARPGHDHTSLMLEVVASTAVYCTPSPSLSSLLLPSLLITSISNSVGTTST